MKTIECKDINHGKVKNRLPFSSLNLNEPIECL